MANTSLETSPGFRVGTIDALHFWLFAKPFRQPTRISWSKHTGQRMEPGFVSFLGGRVTGYRMETRNCDWFSVV